MVLYMIKYFKTFKIVIKPYKSYVKYNILKGTFDEYTRNFVTDSSLPVIIGRVQYNGCSHWDFDTGLVLYRGCSKEDLLNIGKVLAYCWDLTKSYCPKGKD